MSIESPKLPASAEDLHLALRARQADTLPAEREFLAQLHRRLVAAGAPPAPAWFAWVREVCQETWGGRPVLLGALLGSLVTGTLFTLLAGTHPGREANPAAALPRAERRSDPSTLGVRATPPVAPALIPEHKSPHTVGDRRPVRDRPAEEVEAERPERPRIRFDKR
jgi:hypothetical protein